MPVSRVLALATAYDPAHALCDVGPLPAGQQGAWPLPRPTSPSATLFDSLAPSMQADLVFDTGSQGPAKPQAYFSPTEMVDPLESKAWPKQQPLQADEGYSMWPQQIWAEPPPSHVHAVLVLPVRSTLAGAFPLNGTYFQVGSH